MLKELFQLDQPNLDFGLYRIMHAKSAEVSLFLDNDLLQQVKAAFGQYKTADKAELEKKLSELIASIEAAGMNPDDSPKFKDLRARLKSAAVDVVALESEVYDHLFRFSIATTPRATSSPSVSTSRASTPSLMRARKSRSTGPTRTSTTSRRVSTCATTLSA